MIRWLCDDIHIHTDSIYILGHYKIWAFKTLKSPFPDTLTGFATDLLCYTHHRCQWSGSSSSSSSQWWFSDDNDVQGDTEERVYEAGKLHGTATFTSHTGDREERFVQIMIMIINLGVWKVCQQNYDHDGGKIFTMDSFSNFELTN